VEYSQIILNFMESRGITGYKLSKETDISVSLFSKWKKSPTSRIDALTVNKIAKYFDVSTDFLLGNINKKEEYNRKLNKLAEEHADNMAEEAVNEYKKTHPSANETDERIALLASKYKDGEKLFDILSQLSPERLQATIDVAQAFVLQQKLEEKK